MISTTTQFTSTITIIFAATLVRSELPVAPDGPSVWNVPSCSVNEGKSPSTQGVQSGVSFLYRDGEAPVSNAIRGGCQEMYGASDNDARIYVCGSLRAGSKDTVNQRDAADATQTLVNNCTQTINNQSLTGGTMNILTPEQASSSGSSGKTFLYVALHNANGHP